jgi:hypothetical protein
MTAISIHDPRASVNLNIANGFWFSVLRNISENTYRREETDFAARSKITKMLLKIKEKYMDDKS